MKAIPGYQVDEVAAVSRMAIQGVRPYCRTRKHQRALFRSWVNGLVNLGTFATFKFKFILYTWNRGATHNEHSLMNGTVPKATPTKTLLENIKLFY